MSARSLDHLVHAVDDLDRAAAFYERMGFHVGGRNRHPWGTENRLIQFRSSFLELIAVADAGDIPPHAPGVFSFGAFVRDYLAEREGLAMIALDSRDATADAAAFTQAGIANYRPFSFERNGSQPDGTTTRVAFSLAFATDDRLPGTGFFVCQQHNPHAFWNPQLQQHPNGAIDITDITVAVPHPHEHDAFFTAFAGAPPNAAADCYQLGNGGALHLAGGSGASGLAGFAVTIENADPLAGQLAANGIAFRSHADRILVDTRWRDSTFRLAFQAAHPAT